MSAVTDDLREFADRRFVVFCFVFPLRAVPDLFGERGRACSVSWAEDDAVCEVSRVEPSMAQNDNTMLRSYEL